MRAISTLSALLSLAALVPAAYAVPVFAVPPALAPGAKYRLIFVTSGTTAATSTDISTYNAFATAQANLIPSLAGLNASWTIVGGTNGPASNNTFGVTALQNVGSSSAPVYDLAGNLVGASMTAICAGSATLIPVNLNQAGNTFNGNVWTGSADGCGFQNRPLGGGSGSQTGQARHGNSSSSNSTWLSAGNANPSSAFPIYAVSPELTVPGGGPPSSDGTFQVRYFANLNLGDSLINITNSGARGAGLAAGTTATTTGAI